MAMGIFYKFKKIITFERSKKTKKMVLLKVVLDQLYQLMVFETPFREEDIFVKILDVHLNKER